MRGFFVGAGPSFDADLAGTRSGYATSSGSSASVFGVMAMVGGAI